MFLLAPLRSLLTSKCIILIWSQTCLVAHVHGKVFRGKESGSGVPLSSSSGCVCLAPSSLQLAAWGHKQSGLFQPQHNPVIFSALEGPFCFLLMPQLVLLEHTCSGWLRLGILEGFLAFYLDFPMERNYQAEVWLQPIWLAQVSTVGVRTTYIQDEAKGEGGILRTVGEKGRSGIHK